MGSAFSKDKLAAELEELLHQLGKPVKTRMIRNFVKAVQSSSPWFIVSGSLSVPDWEQVKANLQSCLQKDPENFPIANFSLWRLVRDSLFSDKMEVKKQLKEVQNTFEEIQEREVLLSVEASTESSSEATSSEATLNETSSLEESEAGSLENEASSSEENEASSSVVSENKRDEEKIFLKQEIREIKRKLKKAGIDKHFSGKLSNSWQPPYAPNFVTPTAPPEEEAVGHSPNKYPMRPWSDSPTDQPVGGVRCFPVIEVPVRGGPPRREHQPLQFKDLKNIKQAVKDYGAQAPFTLALVESFSSLNLTPSDWMQLCRSALDGGDFLLWRGDFQDRCRNFAEQNAAVGHADRSLEMLTGTGPFEGIQQQVNYDLGVYAQITNAALGAWKALPNANTGDQLSKVLQGPAEPFQEFVDRIMQVATKIFGNLEPAMPVIKHIAFENANKYCQDALRSHRDKSLHDYLKICRHIDSTHALGQVIAAAVQRPQPQPRAYPKACFACGQSGHFKKQCPNVPQQGRRPPQSLPAPDLCRRCHKGYHWDSNCRSRYDAQGNPLSGNGVRGPLRAPQPQVYGAQQTPVASGTVPTFRVPLPRQGMQTSQLSSEQHQVAQDWTSVPPPERY